MSEPDLMDRVAALAPTLDRPTLERVLGLLIDEIGWFEDHHPDTRRGDVVRFSCTDDSYHRCSFMLPHTADCDGTCGTGTPCVADYSQVWCHCSGFDCPDCKVYDELTAIVEAASA